MLLLCWSGVYTVIALRFQFLSFYISPCLLCYSISYGCIWMEKFNPETYRIDLMLFELRSQFYKTLYSMLHKKYGLKSSC